ncbi:MAG: hypothetical protein M1441_01485 [Candidatus Parvarchaeota archaeon]|nr:hypothetical protein [Candidatus Parvarchaeota archaeon]
MGISKKGQGLPINTIILIAIGLLVLVLFITFILGGFKGLAPVTGSSSSSLSTFETQCSTYCAEAASSNTPNIWCGYAATVGSTSNYHCYNSTLGNTGTSCTLDNGSVLVNPNYPGAGTPPYLACS